MGNTGSRFEACAENKVPPKIKEQYFFLPTVGDTIDVHPAFQCSVMSSIVSAGSPATAIVDSVTYGIVRDENSEWDENSELNKNSKQETWAFKVSVTFTSSTQLQPKCSHHHTPLDIIIGMKQSIRHGSEFGEFIDQTLSDKFII